ncbi:ATP-binding protein [Rhodanobacter sp. B2A1Ga4]|uniref:ATP-binding response regulator n=1 Tax=Rhodanobacter sp. B2A1Ga4 TaxID=2778647 RepID=UPI001FD35CD8|nr:ATP-binding protein [Rhodanobacter sp. B2A1Ga4]
MNILSQLEGKVCINEDRRELAQAYLRVVILVSCMAYCFSQYDTTYLRDITVLAFLATLFWLGMAWRRVGRDRLRHIGALIYDCSIIGLVMIGFGSGMMGMFAVLLWVSIGYGLRYRSPLYLKLGMLLTSVTFIVSALVTNWQNLGVFLTLLFTLIIIPLALMRPMTEMIKLLERLDAANKLLDEANRTKTRFISDVSHDLLTPVSSIIGYCQLTPPSVDGIRINAYQLTRQIRAIIGRSAAEDLSYDEPDESFIPADLLKQVATIVKPLAESRGIHIEFARGGMLGTVHGPYHSLSICLMNLANNAAKHSAGSRVTLSVAEEPGGLVFDVSDDGVGIPADQQQLIFNRFHRGSVPATVDGLGLGLAIVKDTIERIGGRVDLTSSGAGSTFRLHAPVTIAERSVVPSVVSSPSSAQSAVTQSATVLFVDDEFQSRNAWSGVLREAGYVVHSAASGVEALAAIDAGNRYDICVLDYRMPGMNGIELASAIRERQPAMRLIAISADKMGSRPSVFTQALETSLLDGALQKPLHPTTLLATVERLRPTRNDQQVDVLSTP